MKTYLDCFPCFLKQALNAGRIATDDETVIKELLNSVGEKLREIPAHATPPETGDMIYRMLREHTGKQDPFLEIKERNIREALDLLPSLREKIRTSSDPLLTAIRIAIAGNVMDMGVGRKYQIKNDLEEILEQEFGIFDYETFKASLEQAESVLYLGDNAGESVFDRILIRALNKPVVYAVREVPVINDVTMKDALASGLEQDAVLISNGSSAPGTILSSCSPEFRKRFEQADMIISKGQGNYEGLSGSDRTVFFLLKAKCRVISRDLGVQLNDIILKKS